MPGACKPRWYRLTPDRLLLVLLAIEGLLWLSERFRWFAFNEHKGWTVLVAVAGVGVFSAAMLLWFLLALVFKWRFQYSLLSLLVMPLAVVIAFGWLAVEMRAAKKQRDAVAEIEKLDGLVNYDFETDPSNTAGKPPEPAWLRGVFGDDLFVSVTEVDLSSSEITDAGLAKLEGFTRLRSLWLSYTKVSDNGLEYLRGLTQLQVLLLDSTKVSDAGLEHLKGLTQLQVLLLEGTKVSDAGLEHLKGLSQLDQLDLSNTNVSDAGLERLKGLSQLQHLWLDNTKVSDAGLKHIKGLTQLQSLTLCGTEVSDAGLVHLKGLTHLQWLYLNGTKVTGAGFKKLQEGLPKCLNEGRPGVDVEQ